jgi:hypothetical protein
MAMARSDWWIPGLGVVWVVAYFGARAALEALTLTEPMRIAVALAPLLPFLLFFGVLLFSMRGMDELHRKVQMEALAIAYPLAVLLLMVLGLLELAVELSPDDWSYRHVWAFLPLFYFAGLAIAWRRYR